MDLAVLYSILVEVARRGGFISYGELTDFYDELTDQQIDYTVASANNPLTDLNRHLHAVGLPPLSAIVGNPKTKEPGGGFWRSTPGIPRRPEQDERRQQVYSEILQNVYDTVWPIELPRLEP